MIRLVATRQLGRLKAECRGARNRVAAVQRRLARMKAERDQLLVDFDARAVLVQERAGHLENDLAAAIERGDELARDLTSAQTTISELLRVQGYLCQAVEHFADAADGPVRVLLRDGLVHSAHRAPEDATRMVQQADPSATGWSPGTPDRDHTTGWVLITLDLPQVGPPPHAAEIQAYFTSTALPDARPQAGADPDAPARIVPAEIERSPSQTPPETTRLTFLP